MAFKQIWFTGYENGWLNTHNFYIDGDTTVISTFSKSGSSCARTKSSGASGTTAGALHYTYPMFEYYTLTEIYIGMHLECLGQTTDPTKQLITIYSTTGHAYTFRFGNNLCYLYNNAGTLIATGTRPIPSATVTASDASWFHFQVRIILGASGIVQTRINGLLDINYSGDTRQGGTDPKLSYIRWYVHGYYRIGGVATNHRFHIDNLFSGTGGWPGEIKVGRLVMAGDYVDGSWSPSTGVDLYTCIDEFPASNTDYIFTTLDGDIVKIEPQAPPADVVRVWGVQGWLTGYTNNAFEATAKMFLEDPDLNRDYGHDSSETGEPLSYMHPANRYAWAVFKYAPDGSDWTPAKLAAIKIGVEAGIP